MAGQIFNAPISLISLVEEDRQFFKSKVGVELTGTPIEHSFCVHAIAQNQALVVPDATQDLRFADCPLVTGDTHIRFYAGASLKTKDGHQVGTLCVLDTEPRPEPTPEQVQVLEGLASQVMELMEARLQKKSLHGLQGALEGTQEVLKASQKRWRRSEQMAKLALDAGHLGMWEWDKVQRRTQWSGRMFQLMGISPAQGAPSLAGWLKRVRPQDRAAVLSELRRARPEGDPFQLKFRLKQASGQVRWICVIGNHLLDETGRRISSIGVAWDASPAERQREELETAREAAEAANRAKDVFLTNVSHELRTPLNGVLGMTDLLLDTELTDEQQQLVRIVHDAGLSLVGMVTDIMEMSLIEACKLPIKHRPFAWSAMLEQVMNQVQPEATRKGIALTLEQAADDVPCFLGDDERIQQILLVYLTNALKFTAAGSVHVKVKIDPSAEHAASRQHKVLITVRDTGPGISPEGQSKLFALFAQLDGSTTRKHGGFGLGLAIARRLAELMGGSVGVTSSAGEGATFWLKLRLEATDLEAAD